MEQKFAPALSRRTARFKLQAGRLRGDNRPDMWLLNAAPRWPDPSLTGNGLVLHLQRGTLPSPEQTAEIATALANGRPAVIACMSFDHAAAAFRHLAEQAGYHPDAEAA